MSKAEEHISKFIEKRIPRPMWGAYKQIVDAMKEGFYEGVRYGMEFQRDWHKKVERVMKDIK